MNTENSLNHTKCKCKYHIVCIPQYRRKSIGFQFKGGSYRHEEHELMKEKAKPFKLFVSFTVIVIFSLAKVL